MTDEIIFTFATEGVSARAVLLHDRAPLTCQALLRHLPLTANCHHGIYSGSEIAMILPKLVKVTTENATSDVLPGDLAFTWMTKGSHYGVKADFAELCWFYDRDARPSMWEGPVEVNVFGQLKDAEAFYEVCRRMRTEGAKALKIRRG